MPPFVSPFRNPIVTPRIPPHLTPSHPVPPDGPPGPGGNPATPQTPRRPSTVDIVSAMDSNPKKSMPLSNSQKSHGPGEGGGGRRRKEEEEEEEEEVGGNSSIGPSGRIPKQHKLHDSHTRGRRVKAVKPNWLMREKWEGSARWQSPASLWQRNRKPLLHPFPWRSPPTNYHPALYI